MPSAVLLLLQDGAPLRGRQALSAALARGSVLGTTWFLLLISSLVLASSHRRAAAEAVAACRWWDKADMEEGVEDITVMRLGGGKVVEGGQVEEEEEVEGGTIG